MAGSFKTAGAGLRCDGAMKSPDIGQAVQFLAANARVVDRRSYERLFEGGGAQPVRDAVAAYRNPDGGFGQALEPDGRAPASQSAAVELALRILHQTNIWDEDLVAGACGWLEATAPAEGGTAFADPVLDGWPHAPWWIPEEGRPASLIMTGLIAGTLHARQVRQPWLDRATEVTWDRIGQITTPTGYGMLGVLRFLQYVPTGTGPRRFSARSRRSSPTAASSRLSPAPRARCTPRWTSRRSLTRWAARCSARRPSRRTWTISRTRSSPMAAGPSTGWPGPLAPNGTGAATSPSTLSGCCAPTHTCEPGQRPGSFRD